MAIIFGNCCVNMIWKENSSLLVELMVEHVARQFRKQLLHSGEAGGCRIRRAVGVGAICVHTTTADRLSNGEIAVLMKKGKGLLHIGRVGFTR